VGRRAMRWPAIALALGAAWVGAGCAMATENVLLGGAEHWKYITFDPATRKVFVAHGDEVTVIDAGATRVTGHVQGIAGAHGVTIVPGGHGYATSSKSATVTVFDPRNLGVLAVLKAGDDANTVTYDPTSRRVFAGNDDAGTITVIDAMTDKVVTLVRLPGGEGIESMAADGTGGLFVNHSAGGDLVRIDTHRAIAGASWKLPDCAKPQGIAADNVTKRLFVSCESGRLLVLDQHDARVVASLPIGKVSDTVLLDAQRHRVYAPSSDGVLSVIGIAGPDRYVAMAPINTGAGARTAALDPATGRIYLVVGNPARLLVVDPQKPGGVTR
jgi:DNA-binding beta-propeller fold protein YncE